MKSIASQLALVQQSIAESTQKYQRPDNAVTLLAVSKRHSSQAIREAWAAGQRCFGESYLQEAEQKITELADLDIEWHFIGPIQSNKTRPIAQLFDWVHSVDRLKIAQRLSDQRPDDMAPLNICLQVNISGEATKSGMALEELPAIAASVAALPRLKLRGLMAIPAHGGDFESQREPFRRLREAQQALIARGHRLDTLSMGMSGDIEAAIAEGSTLVRVGTAIFGTRQP